MFCWSLAWRGLYGVHQAVVTAGHRLYSFVGDVDDLIMGRHFCVYIFNTVHLRWAKLPAGGGQREQRPLAAEVPCVRDGHSAVLVEDTVVYVWGGRSTTDNRLYAFHIDAHRWLKTEVSGSVPGARCHHSACSLGKLMYIHGGRWPALAGFTNDTYKLDTATMLWSLINTRGAPPPATECHSATMIGTKMFVFGGHVSEQDEDDRNDVRVFDTESALWLSGAGGTSPAACFLQRHDHHAAFAHGGQLYMFADHYTFKGLWRFDTTTFSWKKVEPKGRGPSKRKNGACCHTVGERLVLFLGTGLYILDLNPSLKTFCKLAVVRQSLEQSQLPQDLQWELAAMTSGGNWHQVAGDHWLYGVLWPQVQEGGNGHNLYNDELTFVSRWEQVAGGIWQRVGTVFR